MKKWLKNSKGLTLVELLAVIVILGIVAAIAVPAIGNTIEKSKDKADVGTYEMIVDAATRASLDKQADGETGAITKGTIETVLKTPGYLTKFTEQAKGNTAIQFKEVQVTVSGSVISVIVYGASDKVISISSGTLAIAS
ncbi:type II secretion system protein [Cohnella sp. GCM10027633]|uniref:type II secretion system protein n=1 Tax=unclassified Cohnella TaxID=2636738 RepID=UPI0036382167